MSRSKKKHPYIKIAGKSDKKDKTISNKKLRKINKLILKKDGSDSVYKILREVSNTWDFSSDGLAKYLKNCDKKYLRK